MIQFLKKSSKKKLSSWCFCYFVAISYAAVRHHSPLALLRCHLRARDRGGHRSAAAARLASQLPRRGRRGAPGRSLAAAGCGGAGARLHQNDESHLGSLCFFEEIVETWLEHVGFF